MKHIIVGTAGHIDHGKTTLVKALTGRETDRLEEEQKRGISIELGFTYFDLDSGKRVGIVDVPGHEKFVKNMLAGVMGMDIVILIIAADEGVMPQTSEHLAILDILGIEKGFVVLTKSDLVEEEWLELVKEDVGERLQGSFLENTPIIPVSSTKKTGIKEVIDLIEELSLEIHDRDIDDMPRLPVDRVFSISGFGTIVTGTLLSGTFSIGDEVQVFPGDKIGRIRSLQVHDMDTDKAYAGQRVAINIAGLKKGEIHRGSVIAPKNSMKETLMLDVKIKLIKDIDRVIENRTRLRVYIGTKEVLCRLVLLDKEVLNPGEEAYAQLRLEEKVVAKPGDKFIVRFYSPMFTIGGGKILESNPGKKKRFDLEAIKELEIKDQGRPIDIIENIILDKSRAFPSIKEIATSTAMLEENVKEQVEQLDDEGKIIVFNLTREFHVIHLDYFNKLKSDIIKELEDFHKQYPLRKGMSKEEIRSKFLGDIKSQVGDRFIDLLIEKSYIGQEKEKIYINDFEIKYNDIQLEIKEKLINLYKDTRFEILKKEDIFETLKYDDYEIEQVFNSLISNGDIIKLNEETFLYKDSYEEGINIVKDYIKENGSITVAEYRDRLNTNRRMAIALLENFDGLKITKRDGDKRLLLSNK